MQCAVHFLMLEQIQVLSEAPFCPLITANGSNKDPKEMSQNALGTRFLIASRGDLVSATYNSHYFRRTGVDGRVVTGDLKISFRERLKSDVKHLV